jgi:hypothetical protein
MQKIIAANAKEKLAAVKLREMDDIILHFRGLIRAGEHIDNKLIEKVLL